MKKFLFNISVAILLLTYSCENSSKEVIEHRIYGHWRFTTHVFPTESEEIRYSAEDLRIKHYYRFQDETFAYIIEGDDDNKESFFTGTWSLTNNKDSIDFRSEKLDNGGLVEHFVLVDDTTLILYEDMLDIGIEYRIFVRDSSLRNKIPYVFPELYPKPKL